MFHQDQPSTHNPLPVNHLMRSGACPGLPCCIRQLQAYREHQATAARISLPEEARTLVAYGK